MNEMRANASEIISDEEIISLFNTRNEQALKHIKAKYSRTYFAILKRILSDGSDIEELEDDILLSLWQSIPPKKPTSLGAYVCKIARNLGIDRTRYNTRKKRDTEYDLSLDELCECIPDPSIDLTDSEEIRGAIDLFLRGLDTGTRVLFVRRYFYLESVSSLANRFGLKRSTVSVRLLRAREQLRATLEKEDIYL